ncbi:MAG TPA: hypothetical protein VMA37_04355 [Acetobacteraceae bacterium]|nr:hypothetical protein [Acetobacteraceae bacterium]
MGRLWGQCLAAVFLISAFNIFLPGSIQQNEAVAALVALVVLALFGSGVLAAVADVDTWRDKGVVLGTVWAAAGAVLSKWLFAGGTGSAGAMDQFAKSIASFDVALRCATSTVGNAMPLDCGAPAMASLPSSGGFGALVWALARYFATLAIGMAIIGIPVYLLLAATAKRKAPRQG